MNRGNEGNLAICDNMDSVWGHYAEGNKLEKGKYHTISLTCGILKTKWNKAKQQQQ